MNELVLWSKNGQLENPNTVLLWNVTNKDSISRLRRYAEYLEAHGMIWWNPDLTLYRDHLRECGLAESSVSVHLSSVRSQYRRLLRQRDLFYAMLPAGITDLTEAKSAVDELVARIEAAIHPDEARANPILAQDTTDRQKTWLTSSEVEQLVYQPELVHGDVPVAWRDSALLAVLVMTGIREAECAALNWSDLYHTVQGEPCLLVRKGKGHKQRAVPYGELQFVLDYAERWLAYLEDVADVEEHHPVFWSFWKDNLTLRGRLSARRIGEIVRSYGIIRDDEPLTVAPHDLRRTYARLQYEAGMDLLYLSQNMGHTSIEMTKRYVGETSAVKRRGRNVFE